MDRLQNRYRLFRIFIPPEVNAEIWFPDFLGQGSINNILDNTLYAGEEICLQFQPELLQLEKGWE